MKSVVKWPQVSDCETERSAIYFWFRFFRPICNTIGLWVTVSHFLSIVTMYVWWRTHWFVSDCVTFLFHCYNVCVVTNTLVCEWLCHASFQLLQCMRGDDIHWFVSDCVTLPFSCYNVFVVTIYIGLWVTVSHFLSIVTMYAWWRIYWFVSDVRREAKRSRPSCFVTWQGQFQFISDCSFAHRCRLILWAHEFIRRTDW
jgi:hypothetical protein